MTGLRVLFLFAGICLMLFAISRPITANPVDNDTRAREFIEDHVSHLRPSRLQPNRTGGPRNFRATRGFRREGANAKSHRLCPEPTPRSFKQ